MPDQQYDLVEFSEDMVDQPKNRVPFGGTISSIFLMGAFSLGLYLLAISITNDFTTNWKAAYWFATIVTFIISVMWTMSICGRYGLAAGDMMGSVLLSCVAVVCLIVLALMLNKSGGPASNGEIFVGVLAATFGVAALAINAYRTNLVFGVFLTVLQISLSLILLVVLVHFWSARAAKRR